MKHFTDEYTSSGHLYLVRLLGKDVKERNELITRLAEAGVATNVHYKPLPMHTAYKNMGLILRIFHIHIICIVMRLHCRFIHVLLMNR